MRRLWVLAAVAVFAMAGCASPKPPGERSPAPAVTVGEEALSGVHDRLIYQILVGEFAGSRGAFDRAAQAYAEAMDLSPDSGVAQRAARVALFAERYALAQRAANRWLELEPGAREAHRVIAVAALRQGNAEAAGEAFVEYLPPDEGRRKQALMQLGQALAQEEDTDTARAVASRLAERFPENPAAQLTLARVALTTGHAEQALRAARKALQLRAGWRAAELVEVQALRRSGRQRAALDKLERMVRAAPGDYELRREYARALAAAGRAQKALVQFHELLGRQPDDERILLSGALLALQAGKHQQAHRWLQRLLALEARTDAAHYYLGRLAANQRDYQTAIEHFRHAGGKYRIDARLAEAAAMAAQGRLTEGRRRLETLRAENAEARVRAYVTEAELLRREDRMAESLGVLDRALEAHSDNVELLYARAMTRIQADRVESGLADLERIIEQDAQHAAALNALGYTLANRGRSLARAEQLIKRAYRLSPGDPAIIDSRGWVAYRQGRLEEALKHLERAYGYSDDAEIAAHLGEVLWKMGERERARRVWDKAKAAHPDHEVLRETIQRLTR